MDPADLRKEGGTMRNHEKRHKDLSIKRDKKDLKDKTSDIEPKKLSAVESHHALEPDKETTARISFLIDYTLVEGDLRGKITHRLTDKHEEFSGLDQTTITQFMKRYLSRLEKSVEKMTVEVPPQKIREFAKAQLKEEVKKSPRGEMRTLGLEVIPADASQPTKSLRQGQPFQLQWSFESPSITDMKGEQLEYRVVINGKNLRGGKHLKIGDFQGKTEFGKALTALIPSEPLPPGVYLLEADADFSLKSIKSDWHSECRERSLIQVV